ncbi:T9SS type A sorting domain-containing protein [Sphingobacterium bambusae]|uniref:T9SS type A sorting domain-containing protein n=1 Tax=Sphingobacterium bambusae TaxID=662858 RepID=A0ABW6BI86_9SPHI|nr:T9SS type A sorting domain-containing protein [Sphingobacterium bambusae]WPL50247.1 T9SS type A sorting domain-containing protein [Sphingobacterium bambusae]
MMKKIAFVAFASIYMLQGVQATSQSSRISAKTSSSQFTLSHLPEEDSEKLINNVKVFYNPVAEQITTNFKMSKPGTVAIKVMDALGNEVLNLMNGRLDAGMQNLSFDSNGKLTTGVYFVRVTSGAETVVKRISVR